MNYNPNAIATNSGNTVTRGGKPRRFGMLAFFDDGDIARHQSDLPKTWCVRSVTSDWWRWQEHPIQYGEPTIDGLHLHHFKGGCRRYHWCPNEQYAIRLLNKLANETHDICYCTWGRCHPLNKPFLGRWSHSEVIMAEVQFVWANEHKITEVLPYHEHDLAELENKQ